MSGKYIDHRVYHICNSVQNLALLSHVHSRASCQVARIIVSFPTNRWSIWSYMCGHKCRSGKLPSTSIFLYSWVLKINAHVFIAFCRTVSISDGIKPIAASDNYVKMKLTRENTCLDYPAPCPGSSSSSQSDRKAGPILNKNDDDELIKIIDIDRARKNSFSNSYFFPNTTENFDAHPICESFWNMRRAANMIYFQDGSPGRALARQR